MLWQPVNLPEEEKRTEPVVSWGWGWGWELLPLLLRPVGSESVCGCSTAGMRGIAVLCLWLWGSHWWFPGENTISIGSPQAMRKEQGGEKPGWQAESVLHFILDLWWWEILVKWAKKNSSPFRKRMRILKYLARRSENLLVRIGAYWTENKWTRKDLNSGKSR